MNFYLFSKEDGFDYYALIYSENEKGASELYKNTVGCVSQPPRFISSSQALDEIIYSSNLDDYEIEDLMLDIKKAQDTKETMLILIDYTLV